MVSPGLGFIFLQTIPKHDPQPTMSRHPCPSPRNPVPVQVYFVPNARSFRRPKKYAVPHCPLLQVCPFSLYKLSKGKW